MKATLQAAIGLALGIALYSFVFTALASVSEEGYREQMAVHCGPNVTYRSPDVNCTEILASSIVTLR